MVKDTQTADVYRTWSRRGEPADYRPCAADRFDMLSNVMEDNAFLAAAETALPSAAPPREYPDNLDAALLRTSGVCILATVMAIIDVTVVSVAQRTFIDQFASSQAVVAWTMTGYTLALATVIPVTG